MTDDLPLPGPPRPWSPPEPVRHTTSDGTTAYTLDVDGLPLLSVRVLLPGGAADDPAGKAGTAGLLASMLEESSGGQTTLERAAFLDRLAARVGVHTSREWTTFSLDLHRDRLEAALPLLRSALASPAFDPDDWERVQRRHLAGLEQALDDPGALAGHLSSAILFGSGHPYGAPIDGTPAQAEAIGLDDLRAALAAREGAPGARREPLRVVIVGDRATEALGPVLAALDGCGWVAPDRGPLPPIRAPGRYVAHIPGSAQTVLRLLRLGPPGRHDLRAALDLARVALGGSFTSRLNQRLREEKGYTYGARLGVASFGRAGVVSAGAGVQADKTAPALTDLLRVLEEAQETGFTAEEIERARAQALVDLVETAETRASLAGSFAHEIEMSRDPAELRLSADRILAVDVAAMNEAARLWLDPKGASILLVGDADAILPALAEAGLTGFEAIEPEIGEGEE